MAGILEGVNIRCVWGFGGEDGVDKLDLLFALLFGET